MITRFITAVQATFNPLVPRHRHARVFLAQLPSNARSEMKITTKLLPAGAQAPSSLSITFKDGKEMKLDPATIGLRGVEAEIDQHSRVLQRKEDLGGN